MFYSMGELIALELSLGKAGIDHLNEWIIDCGGNGHVKIDLFAFHEYEDGYLLVSYDYFTDEEFSELTKEDMSYSDDL